MNTSLNFATEQPIHVWCPNIFGFKGGIQVYSAYLIKALRPLVGGAACSVFLLHDRSQDIDSHPQAETCSPVRFHTSGRLPASLRKLSFTAQAFSQAVQHRPKLIISTHLNFTPIAYGLNKLLGIPYWTVAHGVEAWDIQRSLVSNALAHADRILAVSDYTRDRLLSSQSLDPAKVVVLPNTVDAERFVIRDKPPYLLQRYGLSPKQPVLLTVNRLCSTETYRGYDKVLAALPKIRQQYPTVHYLLAGKGDDRPRIERHIEEHQLQDCVTLAGFVPDEELCDHYNLCDVFVMPSKLEGFGIVYLEALACGKPVIGGNQDGAIDALCHGKLGALVKPDDVEDIAETTLQILDQTYPNPLLYQPEALRQRVIDIYGFEQFQRRLANLLQEA